MSQQRATHQHAPCSPVVWSLHTDPVNIQALAHHSPAQDLCCFPPPVGESQGHHSASRPCMLSCPNCEGLCFLPFTFLQLHYGPCSLNVPATFLPQDLCMCCVLCWNALPPDLLLAPSIIPFRSLLRCYLLCEEHTAFPDLVLHMTLITLQEYHTMYLFIFYVACLPKRM